MMMKREIGSGRACLIMDFHNFERVGRRGYPADDNSR